LSSLTVQDSLVKKLDDIPNDLKTQHPQELEKELEKENEEKNIDPIQNLVALQGFIEECQTIDEALDILEEKGAKYGVSFKRGNIHYYFKDCKVRDRRIICAKKRRNNMKGEIKPKESERGSLDQIKSFKASKECKNCPVFYKFNFNEEDGKMSFDKCEEIHNHPLGLTEIGLTQEMREDLKIYTKKSKIIEIKESLEKKYNLQLDYHEIHREFRKLYPRFGDDDARNITEFLKKKNIKHSIYSEAGDNIIQRLFFATPQMIYHYELYSDIVLIDSTYRINLYNIPLIVYSGIDSGGRNIIFGLALVNNETELTHQWCLNEFFSVHKKLPLLCITDQDLALGAVLDKEYPQVNHFLCQWHIIQNLKKHFSYLQNMKLKAIYDKILLLPKISSVEQYEESYQEIAKDLKSKNYMKSLEYLERVNKLKLKWANCCVPSMFTAGIHTTSRIESINAVIKNYINSNSEISDIFDFVIAFEKKLALKLSLDKTKKEDQINPILKLIKEKLSENIFELHLEQYLLCSRYFVEPNNFNISNLQQEIPSFLVKSVDSIQKNKYRTVRIINGKYNCECETFVQKGVLCRHIFYVSALRQEKDLTFISLHPRWLIKEDFNGFSTESLLQEYIQEKSLSQMAIEGLENNPAEKSKKGEFLH